MDSVTDLLYSIVIPTLNEEKLLPVLLNELVQFRSQEKIDFEIIVSDGGSTDKTIEISQEHADKVLLLERGDKINISFGRYKGAANAEGDILIFLNADVRISDLKKFFQSIKNKFINSKYVAMTCRVQIFPEEEFLSDKIFSFFMNRYFSMLNFIGLGMARGECQIIRKNIYQQAGCYNINLVAGEDFELFTRIRKLGSVLFSNKLIVFESPRRYHKWGYAKILFNWFINSASSLILKKSISKKWEMIR